MPNSPTNPVRRKRSWAIALLVMLIAVPIGFLVLYLNSAKSGSEFSPDDFTHRDFSYTKVDWLNWTLSGIQREDRTSDFQRSLVQEGWIKPVSNSEKKWDLIADSVTKTESNDFDASILVKYLKMPFWKDWNADANNKRKAKTLWPAVASLARNYAYWAIPDLMDLVIGKAGLSDQGFDVKVSQIVSEALLQNAFQLIEEENFDSAERSLSAAIDYRTSKKLLETRASVYEQLGQSDLAEADRTAADELPQALNQ